IRGSNLICPGTDREVSRYICLLADKVRPPDHYRLHRASLLKIQMVESIRFRQLHWVRRKTFFRSIDEERLSSVDLGDRGSERKLRIQRPRLHSQRRVSSQLEQSKFS